MITTLDEIFKLLALNKDALSSEDIAYDEQSQIELQKMANELLVDNGLPVDILKDKVVILMHQGYTFSCVDIRSLNGPVLTFTEESRQMVYDFKTVREFVDAYCG